MPTLRSFLVYCALLASVSACASSDMSVTSPNESATGSLRLNPVGDPATQLQPLDAWMGDTLTNALRVRVTNEAGRAVPGALVRFATSGAIVRDVRSDAEGIADAGEWVMPTRDTLAIVTTISATLVHEFATPVEFAARAYRDLSRFGGSAALTLRALPIERADVQTILPLGTFGTEDALPSADALIIPRSNGRYPVRAMSDGVIIALDAASGMVTMRVRDAIRVRMAGMTLASGLWLGRTVRAGDVLGAVQGSDERGLAVRVLDATIRPESWLTPERYGARTHTAFFARYLADSVRSHVYALVRRAAPDLEGRISYDRAGRLVGTWFDATASAIASATRAAAMANASAFGGAPVSEMDPSEGLATVALTFAYDAERPGQVRVALGRALGVALGSSGVHAVRWEDPDPAEVSVASGIVRYGLFASDDEARVGRPDRLLLVQLIDAESIRVEIVSAQANSNARFSARAVTLVR